MIQFQCISIRLSAANLSTERREHVTRLRSMAFSWRELDGDLEGIMSARALSDAATQYCEVVELTALIEKYELQ